jgi:YihY family inner membrane protein
MPSAPSTGKGESIRRRWVKTRRALRLALLKFLEEDSLMVSGSIAYHSLLAIFPLLLLLLGISGIYIRRFELAGRLSVVLSRYLPVRTDIIMQNLVGIAHAYGRIGLLSFLLLLWSSSGVFVPLEKALNRAWEVPEGRPWWRSRLVALEMAFFVGCLILIAATFVGVEIFFRKRLDALLAPSLHFLVVFLYHLLTALSSFTLALLMFVVLFERLPNRPMNLRHALPGALLTAILWETARWLFTLLLPFFNYRQVYGSIGVMVSLMTWLYISSAVILFGAQVSHTLYGSLKVNETTATKAIPISTLNSLGR